MSLIKGRIKLRAKRSLKQKGSSLVEILVSLVILGIGILGIAALQTTSLKSNQNAFLRTQATLSGFDIVERMRANQQAVIDGNYNNNGSPSSTASCLTTAGCSSSQLAAHDIVEWQALLSQNLPSGTGTVCLDAVTTDGTSALPVCDNSGSVYAVTIWWDDDRSGTANQRLVMSFQP